MRKRLKKKIDKREIVNFKLNNFVILEETGLQSAVVGKSFRKLYGSLEFKEYSKNLLMGYFNE